MFRLPVIAASAEDAIEWLRKNDLAIFVTRVGTKKIYSDVDWSTKAALVIGSEAHGVGEAWQAEEFTAIGLPMKGQADSLNVSTSAAIVMYEAVRQRRTRGQD